jgi:hypothetical protein
MIKENEVIIKGVIFNLSKNYKIDADYVIFECIDYPFYEELKNILYKGKYVQIVYGDFNFYRTFSKIETVIDDKDNWEVEIIFDKE